MPGLGTLINAAAIVAAGLCGCLAGSRIPRKCSESVMALSSRKAPS